MPAASSELPSVVGSRTKQRDFEARRRRDGFRVQQIDKVIVDEIVEPAERANDFNDAKKVGFLCYGACLKRRADRTTTQRLIYQRVDPLSLGIRETL